MIGLEPSCLFTLKDEFPSLLPGTAAQALSDHQIAGLKANLKRATGMNNVALDIWIDPAIIGGLVVKIGSRRIDGSLRTKLQKLQLAMKGI